VLAVALLVSVAGSLFTYSNLRAAFNRHVTVEQAKDALSELFQLQLDQETALRGFISTGQPVFLEPYESDEPKYKALFTQLERYVNQTNVQGASAPLLDLRRQHALWSTGVARPLIKNPNDPNAVSLLEHGKIIMDRTRSDYLALSGVLDARYDRSFEESFALLRQEGTLTAVLIALFGLAAIVADAYRSRTQAALKRERAVTDTLQRAFLSGWDMLPHLRVGTAYLSSTRDAAVGGDLFDVHRLDDHRAMLLVADISGKGLSAAVETAQVKYSVRTLTETEGDPAVVLERFNTTFIRSAPEPDAFVSVFVGVLDDRDLTFEYASAGHGSAFVRTGGQVTALPVTGPVIGLVEGQQYTKGQVALAVGDLIVLATDGLTEARDQAGIMLGEDRAIAWIARANPDPQRLVDEIVAQLKSYGGGRITDDLALLVIRMQRAPAGAPASGEHVERHDVIASRPEAAPDEP
jgi:serine phosphatase RsbU (regulator of sigma subunit)